MAYFHRISAALAAVVLLSGPAVAAAASEAPGSVDQTVTSSVSPLTDRTARLDMRFEEEGGPQSGQIRVVLTPTERGLTLMEARTAAEKAFLETLNEPGLGDTLTRIRVVVNLLPGGGAGDPIRTYLFELGDTNSWRVELADPFGAGAPE